MGTNWAAIYARDKDYASSNVKWRLRDMEDHPDDPGWERGECSRCHESFRVNAIAGDTLFDIVFPRHAKSNAPRVIRSVIPITGNQENVVTFDSYSFIDGDWNDGVMVYEGDAKRWNGPTFWRGHGVVSDEIANEWLEEVEHNEAYNEYTAGERPKSIPEEAWEKMVEKGPLG